MEKPNNKKTISPPEPKNKNSREFREKFSFAEKILWKKKKVAQRSLREKFGLYSGEQLSGVKITLHLTETVIQAVLPWVILCGVYGFLISLLHHFGHVSKVNVDIKSIPNIVICLNIVLSLLLIFRTNTAHERFWEARKLWGGLINTIRNLIRRICIVIEEHDLEDKTEKEAILRLVVGFAVAMKQHLRREPVTQELADLMSSDEYLTLQETNHPPLKIAYWIGNYFQQQHERKCVDLIELNALHLLLDEMVNILGGCERILKTPVPLVYSITLKMLLMIYFLLLPWELVNGIHWFTGPVLAFLTFILLSIDEIGAEIEEPFGHDPNDLPLDAICRAMLLHIDDLRPGAAHEA